MSFALSSVPVDGLLAWSLGNGGKGYARINFPFVLGWYNEQPCTRFLSFQHRKEPSGFRHEFVVLKMKDGSVCRVERTGDPNARTRALTFQGSVAHDIIQSFRPYELEKACLDTSRIVAEVHLPVELDLKDVLNICRAIQEAGSTRNYTLQTFNCYFFSLALQRCLTRLVARWEDKVSYETWRSISKNVNDSLLGVDPMTPSLLRIHSILHPCSGPASIKRFLTNIREHFGMTISNLTWENVTNGVFWHYELGATLDNVIKEELLLAWWKAAKLFMVPGGFQTATLDSATNFIPHDESELDSLVHKCLSTLWAIIQLAAAKEIPSDARHATQRLRSNMNPHGQQLGHTDQMKYSNTASNELEEVQALTIAQWLIVLWLHMKHMGAKILGMFIALSVALLWVPASYQRVYIDAELTRIASDLNTGSEHLEKIKMIRLVQRLEKLYKLAHTNRWNTMWEEFPWDHVTSVINRREPSFDSLLIIEEESVLIAVLKEGQSASNITISDFQRHILQRIELQAKLVERVWLGSAVKISTEIKQMLSLVWATFRNDPFDACTPQMKNSSPIIAQTPKTTERTSGAPPTPGTAKKALSPSSSDESEGPRFIVNPFDRRAKNLELTRKGVSGEAFQAEMKKWRHAKKAEWRERERQKEKQNDKPGGSEIRTAIAEGKPESESVRHHLAGGSTSTWIGKAKLARKKVYNSDWGMDVAKVSVAGSSEKRPQARPEWETEKQEVNAKDVREPNAGKIKRESDTSKDPILA